MNAPQPIVVDIGRAVETLQASPALAEEMGRLLWPLGNPQELLQVTRTLVHDVLSRPHSSGHKWSYQGLGMVRTNLDADGIVRLNVWHPRLRLDNISSIHTHPWDLKSYILNGSLGNVRYLRHSAWPSFPSVEAGTLFPATGRLLGCGTHPNGAGLSDDFDIDLCPQPIEGYVVGEAYWQGRDEIHATQFGGSAVSLNIRTNKREDSSATVFWPRGTEWVDAKQRAATFDEVNLACWQAVEAWETF